MNQCFFSRAIMGLLLYSNACYVKYRQQFNIYSIIFFDGSVLSEDQYRLSRDFLFA